VENKLETWKLALSVLGEKLQNGLLKTGKKLRIGPSEFLENFLNDPFWN